VLAHPDEADSPGTAILLLVPREAPGRRVDQVWDTLGMRATRSDSLILDNCFVPTEDVLYQADDILPSSVAGRTGYGHRIQPCTWEWRPLPARPCVRWCRKESLGPTPSLWLIIQMFADE